MAEKVIYTITVSNFNKYNSSLKKGHKCTLVSNNFCTDSKLGVLPVPVRWLFLGIVLTCGDHTRDTIEMNERQLRDLLESSWSIERALEALKQIQVLSYAKNALFLNRIEKNRIEKKVIEVKQTSKAQDKEENAKIWLSYFTAYRLRYGIEPIRNAQVNSQIAGLRKKLGVEEACQVVQFFLTHNDAWYLKNTHAIGDCLKNAESLRTQMLRGKAITLNDARRGESQIKIVDNVNKAKEGGF